jgi:protein XRP2
MGCNQSQPASNEPPPKQIATKAAAAAPKREKKNRFDYMFAKKVGETLIKLPGQIDGEQFLVEELENCKVFLVDHSAQIQVDECVNCEFFIGPVASSAFIRNCKNCKFTMVVQQFRCRDLQDCDLALYCQTEPIIETSVRLRFACFNAGYFDLKPHMDKAGIDPFNNNWSMVYDFTANTAKPNWSYLPEDEVPSLIDATLCEALDGCACVIPTTAGARPRADADEQAMVLLPSTQRDLAEFLLAHAAAEGWTIGRTRLFALTTETVGQFAKDKARHKELIGPKGPAGKAIGLELVAPGIQAALEALFQREPAKWKPALLLPADMVSGAVQAFFIDMKEEQ